MEPHFIDEAIYLDIEVTCENFESEVNEVLDRRQAPESDRRLAEHASECEACHEIFREYILVDDSLKLCRGEIERILAEGSKKPTRSLRYHAIGILSTVALLVLMGLIFMPQPHDRYRSNLAMNDAASVLDTVARDVEIANQDLFQQGASEPTGAFTPDSHRKFVNLLGFSFQRSVSTGRRFEFAPDYFADSRNQLTTLGNEFGNQIQSQIQSAFAEYSSELKVVGPVSGSVGLTLEIIRTLSNGGFSRNRERGFDPDLGRFILRDTMLVSV